MPDTLTHALDSVVYLTDTVFIKQNENYELLNKVNAFYDSAWSKLIIIGSVAFAIVGIVIPLAIQWYQKRTLKISESLLKASLTENLAEEKAKILADLDKIISAKIEVYEKKLKKTEASANAKTFHLQGNEYMKSNKPLQALGDYLEAIQSYAISENFLNLQVLLKAIATNCIPKLTLEEIDTLKSSNEYDINEILEKILQVDINSSLLQYVREVRLALTKIPRTKPLT